MDLDKEICLRFKPLGWLKQAWGAPVLLIVCFCLWVVLLWMPWDAYEMDWPAWVQAIGSVAAILVAIQVSDKARADLQRQRDEELAKRDAETRAADHAHAVRLDAFLAELIVSLKMLKEGQSDTEAIIGHELVKAFERTMERAQTVFDTDTSPVRMRVIAQCRFNFSSILVQLQRCEEKVGDERLYGFVQRGIDSFSAHRKKLSHCSGLTEHYSQVEPLRQ
ncbi:hypothetical protein [Pseudomonas sp. PA1(2017)]|uniref:hypothetical protein n=1 Tax=Pseudomonas sp. PA1(2017) TaxID=1932113 RepID=UPI00096A5FEC|nr:hypothetical protein [Pseudomonas sp. PA1(2017)]